MDISDTIKPNSDQLNAIDLIGGPVTVKIAKVNKVSGDQPVVITLEGDYKLFKPCKTVRALLATGWGLDASQWVGREMIIYCDPEVVYAGQRTGGIRVSHMSHIKKDFTKALMVSKGKFKTFLIKVLSIVSNSNKQEKKTPTIAERLPRAIETVKAGTITKEDAIKQLEKHGEKLTEEQLKKFD